MQYCWLCDYNREPEARMVTQFIAENAGNMGVPQLAAAVHDVRASSMPDGEGIGIDVIKEHIAGHTLMPAVRVAGILRSLLDLSDKLSHTLTTTDEEGNTTIEKRNVEAYLKVTAEIMQMYRSGNVNRLLFAGVEPGAGAPPNQ